MKWAVLACFLAFPAISAEPESEYGNARSLAARCHNAASDIYASTSCYEFLRGLSMGLAAGHLICLPNNLTVSNGNLADIFVGYLARHPAQNTSGDMVVAWVAFAEAFPCKPAG